MIQLGHARERWEHLHRRKSQVVDRAEKCAALTIPTIMPPDGHTEGSKLPQPYQALGAKAINTLAAKILLALFPPNTSFFKLGFDELTTAELSGAGEDVEQITENLATIERETVGELEQTKMRPTLSMAVKHLLVTGNYCVDTMPGLHFRGFGLRHFSINRDPEGNVLELVIKEEVSPLTLSDKVRDHCLTDEDKREHMSDPEKTVEVFTVQYRHEGKYHVRQEINNETVPGSVGTYPLEAPRFIALRWTHITDEDYGRGMVDEYYGDLKAYDDLSRDLLAASAAAAKVIFAVHPNSYLKPNQLANAKSGSVLKGNAEEVGTISIDKMQDFQVVLQRIDSIGASLAEAFLMNASVQRNAERVTAEEIRFLAQELEDALGGVYSVLAQELQVPLVRRVLNILAAKGLIPKLPKSVRLSVTTGLDALGRGHEVNKLMQFFQIAAQVIPQEQLLTRIKSQEVLTKIAIGVGVDIKDLILTEEEAAAAQQAQLAQQTTAQAVPGVAQELARQQGGPNG